MTALVLLVAAFAAFALSTDGHHRVRFGGLPSGSRRRALRVAAWVLVVVSTPFPVLSAGWIFGPILWTGLLMLAAGLVFLWLNLLSPGARRQQWPGRRGDGRPAP